MSKVIALKSEGNGVSLGFFFFFAEIEPDPTETHQANCLLETVINISKLTLP